MSILTRKNAVLPGKSMTLNRKIWSTCTSPRIPSRSMIRVTKVRAGECGIFHKKPYIHSTIVKVFTK